VIGGLSTRSTPVGDSVVIVLFSQSFSDGTVLSPNRRATFSEPDSSDRAIVTVVAAGPGDRLPDPPRHGPPEPECRVGTGGTTASPGTRDTGRGVS